MPREPAARLKRGAQKKGGQQWRTSSPNPASEPKTQPVWTSVRSIVSIQRKAAPMTMAARRSMRCLNCILTLPNVSIAAPVYRFARCTAIFPLEDLPEKWQAYTAINASYVVGGKFQPDKFQI